MKLVALLSELEQTGCWLSVTAEGLTVNGNVNALPDHTVSQLKADKLSLMEHVATMAGRPLRDCKRALIPYLSSRGQRRLAFLSRLYPDSSSYNVAASLYFRGAFDRERLVQALRQAAMRHESVFSFLARVDNDDITIIDHNVVINLPEIDVTDLSAAETERIRTDIATTVFNLNAAPLWRMALLHHDAHCHELVVSIHHYISDGWSLVNTLREMAECYATGQCLASQPPAMYRQYARFERQREQAVAFAEAQRFWSEQLNGCAPVISMADCRVRPLVCNDEGARINYSIPNSLSAMLRDLAAQSGVTIASLLNCVFAILLYQRSGAEKFAMGIAYSDRPDYDLESAFGFFVNWLPVPISIDTWQTFTALVQRFHIDKVACLEHGFLPFDEIVGATKVERRPFLHPLFQYLFVSHVPARRVSFGQLELTVNPLSNGRAKLDLTVFLTDTRKAVAVENEGDLFLEFEYNKDIFSATQVKQLIQDYSRLLHQVANAPDTSIKNLNSMNRLIFDSSKANTFLSSFINVAADYGSSVAVIYQDDVTTYAQLLHMASGITQQLRARQINKGDRVVWAHSRSPWAIAALLACNACGAIFTPIDISWPSQRRKQVLSEVGARAVLCVAKHAAALAMDCFGIDLMPVDMLEINGEPLQPVTLQATDPAYLLFTSGSSGVPKGVLISHQSLAIFTGWLNDHLDTSMSDRVLAKTSFVFDAFVREIMAPLQRGAAVVLVADEEAFDGKALAQYVETHQVTVLHATPSLYHSILENAEANQLASLTAVVCGGEALLQQVVQLHQLKALPSRLINVYGPTECTVDVAFYDVPAGHSGPVPLGRAIPGTQIRIVDEQLNDVTDGQQGQIVIHGASVGLGYWQRERLANDGFIVDEAGQIVGYNTGDYGRFNQDGLLEFAGRIDRQIKLQGARIELDEIERQIMLLPSVAKAAVVFHQQEKVIQAFVVQQQTGAADKQNEIAIRKSIAQYLPTYMLPQTITFVTELPFGTGGKVDYQALQRYLVCAGETAEKQSELQLSVTEHTILEHAKHLLKRDDIHVEDNFFDLGGHSLGAVRFLSHINKTFGCRISLPDLFAHANFRLLAGLIDASAGSDVRQPMHIKRRPRV